MMAAQRIQTGRSLAVLDSMVAQRKAVGKPPEFYPDGPPPEDHQLPVRRLTISFADELGNEFTPPDELIEGLLVIGGMSVLYGDSNSGKTFAAISIACAVACGDEWLCGRRTERSAVVYLATESPASVIARLQAHQAHFGVLVPDFAIVHDPISLFRSDADATAVINAVRQIEVDRGMKVGLIVCDTLARMSAGANENSGEDMGAVIARLDRLKDECGAHVLVIHHSGKNAANGARGWSGIKAAIDTEIEVTDNDGGRCMEITKQRDLTTKGERIGFRLEQVTLGLTKWGTPATSCVVLDADAPAKPQRGKRVSEAGGAILEFLRNQPAGVRQSAVANHFCNTYNKSTVSRQLRELVKSGAVVTAAGLFAINSELRHVANQ